ncbi:LOW QUALITY PROTEIN: stromelysin-3-like [Menidia menidia]
MSEQRVRSVFSEALRVWSDVTPLSFREVLRGRADIHIDFMRYWHGDNLPFDGQGGILAHAFFPKTHRQGDIHFDNDESWTLGNHMGTDLLQVAAHEFGHVLGLQHSRVPGAVMSAFYSFSYPLKLHEDDRRGIQHLYGARQPLPRQPLPRQPLASPTTPQAPPPPPPPPAHPDTNEISPDACLSAFDAASMIRGELFFFRSGFVWRLRDGRLQSGYPALVSRHWGGLPPNIDAAFEDKTGNIWFLQGEHFWVFDAGRRLRGPEPLGSLGLTGLTGLTGPGVQAALRWGKDPDYNTLLFTAGGFWRFSPGEGRVQEPRPQSTKDIKDLPPDLDAAFRDAHGYAHFIRGRHYWKFDPVGMSSLEGYPRLVGVDFFGCSNL